MHSSKTKDTERIFKVTFANEFNGLKTNVYTVFIRVVGMEESLLDRLRLQVNEAPSHLFSIKDLSLKTLMKQLQENENFKMNLILIKYDQIVLDVNIGHKNVNDLFTVMGTFMEEQLSSIHKFIHVNLDVSRTIFLPTEMGFPATYQRQIPSVYYYDWSFKKETVNNVVTYKINSQIKIWASGRIGFAVFNTFADIWHGVNRYHSYDAAYPLVMDITINPDHQSAKFSLKRRGKHEEDTVGLKSHVATIVFVKDDFDNKLLQKCSPNTKDFITVSNGDEFKKDHTIYEYDNLNTGYKTSLKAFDSERYMAENSIKYFHHLNEFKTLKQYKTLIGDYILNLISAMTYSYIQPEPETNGFLYTFEPSKQFPITQNDLTLEKSSEYKQGEWILLPETKINVKANYVLKNEEKTMKTWDINLLVDMNVGHTLRRFSLEIARMIPGEKDYRICIDSQKKWLESTIETKATVAAGEDKCDKDDIFMEVDYVGEQFEDQKLRKHNYAECVDRIWSNIHEEQSITCYAIQSSIRKYTYNIKMHEVPAEFSKFFDYILDGMKAHFRSKLTHSKDPTVKLEKDNFKLVVEYPMMSETYGDLTMYTPSSKYKLVSVPMYHWLYVVQRDNLHYNKLYKIMYSMGLMNTCFVTQDFLTAFDAQVHFMNMTSEYTLYKGDSLEHCKNGVWAKKIEGTDKIAVKFVHEDHSLEIVPESDDHYEILLDGKKMEEVSHSEEWMYYNLNKETRVMNILMHRMGGHYLFDGHSLHMDLPKIDMELFGTCIKA